MNNLSATNARPQEIVGLGDSTTKIFDSVTGETYCFLGRSNDLSRNEKVHFVKPLSMKQLEDVTNFLKRL